MGSLVSTYCIVPLAVVATATFAARLPPLLFDAGVGHAEINAAVLAATSSRSSSIRQAEQSEIPSRSRAARAGRADPVFFPGAYYMLVEAAPNGDSLALALDLVERAGLITIPGVAFGAEALRYLRLSFSPEEPVIREGVKRLGAALEKLSTSI